MSVTLGGMRAVRTNHVAAMEERVSNGVRFRMIKRLVRVACCVTLAVGAAGGCASNPGAQAHSDARLKSDARGDSPLSRRYVDGETARYRMTGRYHGRERTMEYAADAESQVVRDEQGRFVEEFRWTRLSMVGQEIPLDESTANFRQRVSLDPAVEMTPPDIAGLNPMLIGPALDLMTFYVDLHPSLHAGKLTKAGDRTYVAHGTPNSWADGTKVIIGEDSIDFELTLREVSATRAVLHVRHVPPPRSSVRLPAAWMHRRVNPIAPNNWVQVQRESDGGDDGHHTSFVAAVGHERFDVTIEIERPSGSILAATMDNPVDVMQRRCADESLSDCGEPARFQIRRVIELRLMEPADEHR